MLLASRRSSEVVGIIVSVIPKGIRQRKVCTNCIAIEMRVVGDHGGSEGDQRGSFRRV